MARRPGDEEDVSVQHADRFLALSKAMKDAGRGDLRKELNKALRQKAKPVLVEAKKRAREQLPQRGGLGAFYGRKPGRVTTKTGRDPGVSVQFSKHDPRLEEEGRLVHPVFGRRRADGTKVVAVQRVRPGIVRGAVDATGPDVIEGLTGVIEEMAARFAREAGR